MRYRLSNKQFFETSAHEKISLLQTLLSQHQPASCVVFCNTKKDCQAVCDALNAVGQSALALHGESWNNATATRRWCVLQMVARAFWLPPTLPRED
ncbi:ATP-dependent RNA helicase [Salmonella enterica subsp. enterica]|uniref:ATP-dependent RNA helicase n=1 Tax=Salmonella enterica I TaxID=59201 RepID=A0A3S4HVY9_SALET|nr:ATP-dependent RNA helicase [Salmonella enterica subsp. enterica]